MAIDFIVSDVIPASPGEIYAAWLDSETHTDMTGGAATASDQVGGSFTAWNDFIMGKNIALVANTHIVQSWRTTIFKDEEPDSNLEINLVPVSNGTEITLIHTNLPERGMQYKQGWVDHYFNPMKAHFG